MAYFISYFIIFFLMGLNILAVIQIKKLFVFAVLGIGFLFLPLVLLMMKQLENKNRRKSAYSLLRLQNTINWYQNSYDKFDSALYKTIDFIKDKEGKIRFYDHWKTENQKLNNLTNSYYLINDKSKIDSVMKNLNLKSQFIQETINSLKKMGCLNDDNIVLFLKSEVDKASRDLQNVLKDFKMQS